MRRGLLAAWLIAAALHSAPLGAQPGGAEPAPAPAPGIKVDRDFMVGFWSDREDCGDLVESCPAARSSGSATATAVRGGSKATC
jgi:hypothetical protein